MRDSTTACPILMCDTWKLPGILCRFQICTEKYQFPDSKKVNFFYICKFMQIRCLYSRYEIQGCGTSRRWILPSCVKIASFVQKLWQISSSATGMPWNDTFKRLRMSFLSERTGKTNGNQFGAVNVMSLLRQADSCYMCSFSCTLLEKWLPQSLKCIQITPKPYFLAL